MINPPGILPTEYNFSWYKTVSGKKSDNKFAVLATTTADKITVSPYLTNTAPSACLANSPCSTTNFLPLKSNSNTFYINPPISSIIISLFNQKIKTLKISAYFLKFNALITSRYLVISFLNK